MEINGNLNAQKFIDEAEDWVGSFQDEYVYLTAIIEFWEDFKLSKAGNYLKDASYFEDVDEMVEKLKNRRSSLQEETEYDSIVGYRNSEKPNLCRIVRATTNDWKNIGTDMTYGGKRPGAGRKPMIPGEKKVQMTITILPKTRERIRLMRKRGIKIGEVVDEVVEQYCEDKE